MPKLSERVQAILFVASEPVEVAQLSTALDVTGEDIAGALVELTAQLSAGPLRVTHHQNKYRLVTAPDLAADIKRFLQADAKTDLSRPALETLAIIAYRGPVTKSTIDGLRGVSSEAMLRNLMQRGLVLEQGSAREPGRPILYGVSQTFLQQVGLSSLDELPALPDAESTSESANTENPAANEANHEA